MSFLNQISQEVNQLLGGRQQQQQYVPTHQDPRIQQYSYGLPNNQRPAYMQQQAVAYAPVQPVVQAPIALPPGWVEGWSQQHQRPFYVDPVTKVSQWERPYAPPPAPLAGPSYAPPSVPPPGTYPQQPAPQQQYQMPAMPPGQPSFDQQPNQQYQYGGQGSQLQPSQLQPNPQQYTHHPHGTALEPPMGRTVEKERVHNETTLNVNSALVPPNPSAAVAIQNEKKENQFKEDGPPAEAPPPYTPFDPSSIQ